MNALQLNASQIVERQQQIIKFVANVQLHVKRLELETGVAWSLLPVVFMPMMDHHMPQKDTARPEHHSGYLTVKAVEFDSKGETENDCYVYLNLLIQETGYKYDVDLDVFDFSKTKTSWKNHLCTLNDLIMKKITKQVTRAK